MPLFPTLRTISNYVRVLRYGEALHSSQKYLIRTKAISLKTTTKPLRQSFGALERSFDRNLNVNIEAGRIHGRVAKVHVNKMGNMASEHSQTGIHSTEKENDDISLPFWIFLWSILAVVAGFIYSKLNKPSEIKLEPKSGENDTTNDEQIARKLVNEIAKKDSKKKPTFRRQRSYEIIDGEVRIHYDVSMLDESLHKRANIEGILESAEVNTIPIQCTSLEDLEFINPGKLPRIVEEGDEELLEKNEQQTALTNVYINEESAYDEKKIPKSSEKFDNVLTSEKLKANSFDGKIVCDDKNRSEFPTNYVTVTQETLIPTESTNDANKRANYPLENNCNELNCQSETNLKEVKNEIDLNESSNSISDGIENSGMSSAESKNTLNNSNTSVYKLSQVERNREHKYTVNRREITKVKSNKEKSRQSDSFGDETSFPFDVNKENEGTAGIGVNSSQLSRDLTSVSLTSPQDMKIIPSDLLSSEHIEEVESLPLEKGTKTERSGYSDAVEIKDFKLKEERDFSAGDEKILVDELPSRNDNKPAELPMKDDIKVMDSSAQQSIVSTCLDKGNDKSKDGILKAEETIESNETISAIKGRNETLDENENCELNGKNELEKTWKSLPSWQSVNNKKHFDTDNSDVNFVEPEKNMVVLESVVVTNNELEQPDTDFTSTQLPMQDADELIFNEEIKEVELLTFENKIGTRKTIFLKENVEHIHGRKEEDTNFDDSDDTTRNERLEDPAVLKDENTKLDILEYSITDEIILAEVVQLPEVEAECPIPNEEATTVDYDALFTKASLVKENVLTAKVITVQDPESQCLDKTGQSCQTILINEKIDLKPSEQNIETRGKTESNPGETFATPTEQDFTPYTSTDSLNYEESPVYSDNSDIKPSHETTDSIHTETQNTHIKVSSIVKKFEEARKHCTVIQNDNTDQNNDMDENIFTNKKHENSFEDFFEIETQSEKTPTSYCHNESIDDSRTETTNLDAELASNDETSEEGDISTIIGDNEEVTQSDICLVIDYSKMSEEFSNEVDTMETKQPDLSDQSGIKTCTFVKSVSEGPESVEHVNNVLDNELMPTSSKIELQPFTEGDNIVENSEEECVIYANQVTDVKTSAPDEAIRATAVYDCNTTVVYASEVCESKDTEKTKDGSNLKEAYDSMSGSLVKSNKEKSSTKVVYTSQASEDTTVIYNNENIEEEKSLEPKEETEVNSNTPTDNTKEKQISIKKTSDNYTPINNESRSFRETSFDVTPLTYSPVINKSSSEKDVSSVINIPLPSNYDSLTKKNPPKTKKDIFNLEEPIASPDSVTNGSHLKLDSASLPDEIPSNSNTGIPVIKTSSAELWQDLPHGETDVDNISDIDEIDIDIIPDENYQKSKSVTDLDEALASFEGLNSLSPEDFDEGNITGSLSKSVPDILDSCREESLALTNPIEKLQKKNLSLSNPEINSKTKPGSKKVTKIKIVHVKFLDMQSDSENVEEDSFIYEGDLPITGKMKRRSGEFSSPVSSPSPDLNKEIAQERWIAGKTNLKQLEFEFGDLFENSPVTPPPLPPESSYIKDELSINGSKKDFQSDVNVREIAKRFENASMNSSVPANSLYESYIPVTSSSCSGPEVSQTSVDDDKVVSTFKDSSIVYSTSENLSFEVTDQDGATVAGLKPTTISKDPKLPNTSSQRPSSNGINNASSGIVNTNTSNINNKSSFTPQNERNVSTQNKSSTMIYSKTSVSNHSTTLITTNSEKPNKNSIFALPTETEISSSSEKLQTSNVIRSTTRTSSGTKIEYTNNIESSSSVTSNNLADKNQDTLSKSSAAFQAEPSRNPRSYRYTPGNKQSYTKVPNPIPDEGKYVIKSGVIATQSTTKQTNERNSTVQVRYIDNTDSPRRVTKYSESICSVKPVTTQAHYIGSPNLSSPSGSPRHGMKLSEKFRMSDEENLAQKPGVPSDQTDGRVPGINQTQRHVITGNQNNGTKTRKINQQGPKERSRQSGRLVTVKSGIISDHECSSDADSEMSYIVPSPRIKAKRFHRPQVHRVDSASSSEADSPRRYILEERRGMDELFGVEEGFQYSSDGSKDDYGRNRGSQSSLREPKLFSKFGDLRSSESLADNNPSSPYRARATIFDPGPTETRKKLGQDIERGSRENVGQRNPNDTLQKSANQPKTNISENHPPPNILRAKATTFDQVSNKPFYQANVRNFDHHQPLDIRNSNPLNPSVLERNLSPTNFLQEGNLDSDDLMSPRTMEFNPFEDLDTGDDFQPFERCHSPSSVYSDTSSVFSFNCDFDPMPPPGGEYEPEVYTCENPMCRKKDILLGPEKTSFKSCPACFTYYCSSECRKLHWPSHKQSCYFGRVNTYVRSIIRLCQRREDLSMYLSQLARDGYKKKGRGVVMAIFNSPELAREFITKGHDAFSGRKPTYSSLTELHREGIISKHRVALMHAVRDYEPNQEFVFNIAVVATHNIPITPAPRYRLNTVLHCIKMPLNDLIVARQTKDYDKVETRLFALPKCSRHEFVNEMEARRHYCRNLSKNLRQYNIKLKEDYPECYRKLCMYVEHNISFEPMTVHGQRNGLTYKCVVAPEQSYPLNAEYC